MSLAPIDKELLAKVSKQQNVDIFLSICAKDIKTVRLDVDQKGDSDES